MELPDKKVVEVMQSRVVTQDEFNYDHLTARPLYTLVTQSDIDEVYRIATSARLAGNPRKRYQLIDNIMHNRGFRKLSAGTNRVAYTYFEDPSIVVKVAADKTAIMDNPREFVNQHKLKPFCTKVFEVDPSGTMGVFERVKPITSREEYLTVASNVFEMLDMITSKYVLADIGTKFFMNVGIRKNFGVVLLDFPYLYEINDPNSLVCKKPDTNSQDGFCGGLIDYDEGFNTLRCNKCGAVYRAQELGSYLKTNKIIMKGTGKMNGIKASMSFVRDGKKCELGNSGSIDIMKEESTVIQHVEEKKPAEKKNGILKVKVSKGDISYTYDVDTNVQNTNAAEYNFGTKHIKRSIDRINNSVPSRDRYKPTYARFSKIDDRGNLAFTIKIPNGIKEILIDPVRVPDEAKQMFIPNYENTVTANQELEDAKSDLLKMEDLNDELHQQIDSMEDDLKQYQEDAKRLGDDFERVSKELDIAIEENSKLKEEMAQSITDQLKAQQSNVLVKDLEERVESLKADRDNKTKYLDNMIKENATLKAQIEELETKNKELEDANLQLAEAEADSSDKASKLEVLVEQLKEELAKVYEDQDNPPATSAQEYTVEATDNGEVIVESNEEEEEDDAESEIFFMNAVYCTLETIVESTGKKTDYKYYDGTDIPKDTQAIVFRDDNGAFLVDADEKLFVGINLSQLEFPEDDLEESKEE